MTTESAPSTPQPGTSQSQVCNQVIQKSKSFMDATGAPGLAVGMVQDGAVICAQGHGLESLKTKTPITTNSNFHMASISKPFAAMAIVQLVLEGKLDLDRPIAQYVPEFRMIDARYQQITTRLILMHRSGMPDVEDYEWDKPKSDPDAALRYLSTVADQTLLSDPGSQFAYSNMAFEVLAVLITRVSGLGFESYADQYVFKPAGMRHSSYLYPAPNVVSQAMPHSVNQNGEPFELSIYPYNRQHAPSSTLESNINDMNRFMISAMGSRSKVLPAKGWKMLWAASPEMLAPERAHYRMGLGWFVQSHNGQKIVFHEGRDDGFSAMMMLNPKRHTGVAVMANTDSPRAGGESVFNFEVLGLEMLDLLSN